MGAVNILEEAIILKDMANDAGYEMYRSNISRLKNYILNNTQMKSQNRFYIAIKEQRNASSSKYFTNRLYKFLNLYKVHGADYVAKYLEYELLMINITKSKSITNIVI